MFEKMGKNITLVGGNGDGQTTKVANQIIVALTIEAVGEALLFASKAGADPAQVRQALMGGFASSRILEVHGERMVKRNFAPGFRIELHQKDLNLALEGARALGRVAAQHRDRAAAVQFLRRQWRQGLGSFGAGPGAGADGQSRDRGEVRRRFAGTGGTSPAGDEELEHPALTVETIINPLEEMMKNRLAVSLIAVSLFAAGSAFAQSTTATGAARGRTRGRRGRRTGRRDRRRHRRCGGWRRSKSRTR